MAPRHNNRLTKVKEMGFTFCITVMSDGEIFDHFPLPTFVGQREWGVTSLVDWLCGRPCTINNVTAGRIQEK